MVVVGAGPTGLMLACELALGGAKARLLEERTDTPNITRAFAVHARTLELLDARGLAEELLPRGVPVREVAPPGGTTLDLRELPTRFGMVLIVPQSGTERVLQARADELGVEIVRGRRGGRTDAGRRRRDGRVRRRRQRARQYVVGCDGAHSTVRSRLGIDFVGKQYETHILLADVQLTRAPSETLTGVTNEKGVVLRDPVRRRLVPRDRVGPTARTGAAARTRDAGGDPRLVQRIAGHDFGMTEMRWSSRFLSERRQARHYRIGRVFLAGDAAHVHSPLGGQGMNTGIGDAMNLGWKLAAAVRGSAPPSTAGQLRGRAPSRRRRACCG